MCPAGRPDGRTAAIATRPRISLVPWWKRTRDPWRSARTLDTTCSRASIMRVGSSVPGVRSESPRPISSSSMPPRFKATRCPASAAGTGSPCTCTPRTLTRRCPGSIANSSSRCTRPDSSVPVATVPNPLTENARSIGIRTAPDAARRRARRPRSTSACLNASSPSPLRADTATMGASARKEPATRSRVSICTSSMVSGSARSALVIAMRPSGTARRRQISKCSRVCGITDSSAATTSTTASMPRRPRACS